MRPKPQPHASGNFQTEEAKLPGFHLPLRASVPILFFVFGITAIAIVTTLLIQLSRTRMNQLGEELILAIGNSTAADVSASLRSNNDAGARNAIEQLQSVRHLSVTMLVDTRGNIEFASHQALIGKTLLEVSHPEFKRLFEEALLTEDTAMQNTGETLFHAQFIHDVDLPERSRPGGARVLLLKYDFKPIFAVHREAALRKSAFYALPVIVITFLGWLLLNRWVLKRLDTLVAATRQIGTGDLRDPLHVEGRDEIAVLANSFELMRQNLLQTRLSEESAIRIERETADRLRQQESRIRLLVENLPDWVLSCDGDGNLEWYDLTTRKWEKSPPHIRPEDWPSYFGFCESDGTTPMAYDQTPLWKAFQGEQVRDDDICIGGRYISASGAPITSPGGDRNGAVVVMHDITDRKRAAQHILEALDEKETLLQEVHHRVKNNLQIVSSILDMQMEGTSDESILTALRESLIRVRSMAMIHEKLYHNVALSHIDFGEYTEALSHAIFSVFKVQESATLQVEVEPIELDIENAVPCGLIINELVSNACKYASSGENKSRIHVQLSRLDSGAIRLAVQDNGPGLPPDFDIRKSETLGLQLVAMLTQQIRGTLHTSNETGARFCLEFKEIQQSKRR